MDSQAGPSNSSTSRSSAFTEDNALERPLPDSIFHAIQYPGFVKPTSVPLVISNLGGQVNLDRAFKRGNSRSQSYLELNFRPDNPYSHPVPGEVVNTNCILFKVTKRRRRRTRGLTVDQHEGEFVFEALGRILRTARFRGMADFQYAPDMSDPVAQLRLAMDRMDVQAIMNYKVPPEKEDYSVLAPSAHTGSNLDPRLPGENSPDLISNLRMFPPPIFSRQAIPHLYNFKGNPMSTEQTIVDGETGIERKRLINKHRWKGLGPASIGYSDPAPTKPPQSVLDASDQADKRILALLRTLFESRPIWTRVAMNNQLTPADARECHNSKVLFPLVSYVFSEGPWRDTMVRLGYDPRKSADSRFYQRLYFRNMNHPIVRTSSLNRRVELRLPEVAETKLRSHIFDGQTVTTETAAFQLCDITDPLLGKMIKDEDGLRDRCDEHDGWYTTHALEQIKTVLRHKFFALLDGYVPSEEECVALLSSDATPVSGIRKTRRQKGKHNMAKGALPPEEAAAARLRATLDNARNLRTRISS